MITINKNNEPLNIDEKELNYEYIKLFKKHPEIFVYVPQNDVYCCKPYRLIIGEKNSLENYIKEDYCKQEEDKKKVSKLFLPYKRNELLSLIYDEYKSHCCVLPVQTVLQGKKLLMYLKNEHEIRLQDKYISGTIEATYDNYFSSDEEIKSKLYEKNIEMDEIGKDDVL